MHTNSRHVAVSVVGTVLMVVLTILVAAWSPPQPTTGHTGAAPVIEMSQ